MRSKYLIWFSLSVLLLSLVVGVSLAAPPAQGPTPTPVRPEKDTTVPPAEIRALPSEVRAKIEPILLSQVAAAGQADFFVWLVEKADLSPVAGLASKQQKGEFVYKTLRETAERSQQALRQALDNQGINYHPFYIANKIMIRGGTTTILADLAARADVARITANHPYQLEKPKVSPNPPHPTVVETNISFVKADQVWAMGYTGSGAVLAGNDTGLSWDHPALINQYRGWDGATANHNYNWWDATDTYPTTPADGSGHGTHTTGTMVGNDGGANQVGMAPGARTIHCKNMDDFGGGDDFTFTECFEWDLAPWDLSGGNPRPDLAPDAVNNSWGYFGGNTVFADEIAALQAAGILVEFSAGNEGPTCGSLRSPGDDEVVLTTGSVNHLSVFPGTISDFSSRGPSVLNPNGFFPDVIAPGENVRSTLPNGDYGALSGTSMAGPHVTGLVGLIWSANPSLRGQVEITMDLIRQTAKPLTGQTGSDCGGNYATGPNNDWGYGTIDALAAVATAVELGGVGTLQGTIITADTQAPLAGVNIRATLSATRTRQAQTNPAGSYIFKLISGTYTIQASRYGYQPAQINDLVISQDVTTTLNLALEVAPSQVISGFVTDGNTGWPLYARIAINGYPFDPIWTDPETGFYSISLAEGIEYTFSVSAWLAGYEPSSRTIGPLTAPQTENFALAVDAISCIAPGYVPNRINLEDFEANDGGYTSSGTLDEWEWGTPTVLPNRCTSGSTCWGTDLDGNYEDFSDQTLTSPVIDLTATPPGSLLVADWQQAWYLEASIFDLASAEVSINGGDWTPMWTHTEGTVAKDWTGLAYNLSAAAGGNAQFRWRLVADSSVNYEGLYVDDVSIFNECNASAGGLVVGNVYDANTAEPYNGAIVSQATGETTISQATPDDPAVADGFYALFAPTGPQVLTATLFSYGFDTQTPTVIQNGTIRQDFNLATGLITYDPPTLEATLDLGQTQTVPFNVTNSGGVPVVFELAEVGGEFIPVSLRSVEVPGYQPPAEAVNTFAGNRLITRGPWTYQPRTNGRFSSIPAQVLLVTTGSVSQLEAILEAYPDIATVDIYPADFQTPSLPDLLAYDTVIVISNFSFADPIALGNVLADYVDQGGTVIQTVPTFFGGNWALAGRFIDEGYSPFIGLGDWFSPASLGNFDAAHPIMQGVQNASDSLRQIVDLNTGAELVAEWTDDEFIATKGSVVALNTFLADGYAWTGDVGLIVHNSIIWLQTVGEVPWLTESPTGASLDPAASQTVTVTFAADIPEITQPGRYTARLRFVHNTIHEVADVPVAMNVGVPETYGKLTGAVRGLGYCDQNPTPLANVNLVVTGSSGVTRTLQTNADGVYQLWLDQAESPLSLATGATDHISATIENITVTAGVTTTQDVGLRWARPCLTVSQSSLTAQVLQGEIVTKTFTISNSGAVSAQFSLGEFDHSLVGMAALQNGGQVRLGAEQKTAETWGTSNAAPLTYGGPDPYGYTFVDSTEPGGPAYQWIEIAPPVGGAGIEISLLNNVDDAYFWPLALPFPFNFYGTNYVAMAIASNGTVYFEDRYLGSNNQPIPGPTSYEVNRFIAPLWDDLYIYPGSVYYLTTDSMVIVEFYRVTGFGSPDPVTWQIILFDDGRMLFQYKDVIFGDFRDNGASATVGIQSATSTGLQYAFDTAALSDSLAICFTPPDLEVGCTFADIPWLTEEPARGSVTVDGSQSIAVGFHGDVPDFSTPGDYMANLLLGSNDPVNGRVVMPVTMTVVSINDQLLLPRLYLPLIRR